MLIIPAPSSGLAGHLISRGELLGEAPPPAYPAPADEMFTTGTMGELSPVLEVDGRWIGEGRRGPITEHLQELHARYVRENGTPLPF